MSTRVTKLKLLDLRVELAADGFMDELLRPASTSATCSGELCIQTDVPPYHWSVTWRLIDLISGLFTKATQEFSAAMAQCLVVSWL